MEYVMINKLLTKNDSSELKLNMVKPYKKEEDFFNFFLNFIIEYNSYHIGNYKYFYSINSLSDYNSDYQINGNPYVPFEEGIKVNEVIHIYKNKLFRNISKDIENRIIVLYVEDKEDDISFYILTSNYFNRKFKKEYKEELFDKEEILSRLIVKSFLNEKILLDSHSEFLVIKDKEKLSNLITNLMKNQKYKILNFDFLSNSELKYSRILFNKNVYDNKLVLKHLKGISYKDIIDKDKEKITFIDKEDYKHLVIKESFK
ncbi:hypothetical protein CPT_Madawaska_038 [Staphylococcus phage Madawaska]|nr:hypothetical protein CPT_Madawaska_038 [Staphylococcus phage Madawaska]